MCLEVEANLQQRNEDVTSSHSSCSGVAIDSMIISRKETPHSSIFRRSSSSHSAQVCEGTSVIPRSYKKISLHGSLDLFDLEPLIIEMIVQLMLLLIHLVPHPMPMVVLHP